MKDKHHILFYVDRFVPVWRQRAQAVSKEAVVCALAAVVAWVLSVHLWGHHMPTFAAIAAVICLAPGIPSHLKQTARMLSGCLAGVVIGEIAWHFVENYPIAGVGVAVFLALLVGFLLSPQPLAPIQAAVSTLLILAAGPAVAGAARVVDVLTGALIGLLFSQVFFTMNPIEQMSRSGTRFLGLLGNGLARTVQAAGKADKEDGEQGLTSITQAHEGLAALQAAVEQASSDVKWTLRGRLSAPRVIPLMRRFDRHAVRLYASTLLLGESLVRALEYEAGEMPSVLVARCTRILNAFSVLSSFDMVKVMENECDPTTLWGPETGMDKTAPLPELWLPVRYACESMERAIEAFVWRSAL